MTTITKSIEMHRLLCPMPVIRTQQAVKKMQVGEVLQLICTDPGTMHDIPTWCRMYGHKILRADEVEKEFIFEIEILQAEETIGQANKSDWD
jgi:TusA-related sulfurtransferase